MTYHERRRLKRTILGFQAATPFSAQNSTQDFNQLQYSIPFQTDDSYEAWSPTRPQAYYADPRYPNLPTHGGPIFNTRLFDPDDFDDRFDGDVTPSERRRKARHKKRSK